MPWNTVSSVTSIQTISPVETYSRSLSSAGVAGLYDDHVLVALL